MPSHTRPKEGLGVLLDVQHGAAVGGPGDRRLDVLDDVGQQRPVRQVLETQHVLAAPDRVLGPREQAVVGAHLHRAQFEELPVAGPLVLVKEDLLRRVGAIPAPQVHRVLLPSRVTPPIPVATVAIRDARVLGFDAPDDLCVQPFLQLRVRRKGRVLVRVLRPQVREHVFTRARVVPEPVVLVDARAVRRANLERTLLGDGRLQTAAAPTRTGKVGRGPGAW